MAINSFLNRAIKKKTKFQIGQDVERLRREQNLNEDRDDVTVEPAPNPIPGYDEEKQQEQAAQQELYYGEDSKSQSDIYDDYYDSLEEQQDRRAGVGVGSGEADYNQDGSVSDEELDAYENGTTPGSYIDPEVEAALRRLLDPINTEEQKALAREQMERQLGQGLADMRAQASWGGLGLTGAVGALEGDLRSKAALGLTDQLLGIDERARQEELQRLGLAAGMFDRESGRQFSGDQAERDRAIDQQRYDNELAMLAIALKEMGIDLDVDEDGSISVNQTEEDRAIDDWSEDYEIVDGLFHDPVHVYNSPPPGGKKIGDYRLDPSWMGGGYPYEQWETADGEIVIVRKGE